MRTKAVTLVTGAVLALVACGGPSTGVVQDKSYSAGYTTTTPAYWSSMCTSRNAKTGSCTSSMRVYHPAVPVYHPARWSMKIRHGEDEGWTTVPSSVWERCTVGQWYESGQCSGEPGVDQDGGAW